MKRSIYGLPTLVCCIAMAPLPAASQSSVTVTSLEEAGTKGPVLATA